VGRGAEEVRVRAGAAHGLRLGGGALARRETTAGRRERWERRERQKRQHQHQPSAFFCFSLGLLCLLGRRPALGGARRRRVPGPRPFEGGGGGRGASSVSFSGSAFFEFFFFVGGKQGKLFRLCFVSSCPRRRRSFLLRDRRRLRPLAGMGGRDGGPGPDGVAGAAGEALCVRRRRRRRRRRWNNSSGGGAFFHSTAALPLPPCRREDLPRPFFASRASQAGCFWRRRRHGERGADRCRRCWKPRRCDQGRRGPKPPQRPFLLPPPGAHRPTSCGRRVLCCFNPSPRRRGPRRGPPLRRGPLASRPQALPRARLLGKGRPLGCRLGLSDPCRPSCRDSSRTR
jgi:hypothetical protein